MWSGDTSGTGETSETSETGPTLDRPRRSRWDRALVVLLVLLVAVAGVLAIRSRTVAADAARIRTRARDLDRQRADVAATTSDERGHGAVILLNTDDLNASFAALTTDLAAARDAQNHFVDVANQAVLRFNHGDISGSVDILSSQAEPAMADITAKQTTVEADLTRIQADVKALEDTVGG